MCHRISAYRELEHQVVGVESSDIAKSDTPTRSEPLIMWNTCQRIPISRGSENRGSRRQGTLASRIRDPRNPEGDVAVWDHEVLVEYRWHHIGNRER
jgi:hypothetical protein